MVQLLNADTNWINPVSRDFRRFGLDDSKVIEIYSFNPDRVVECVLSAMQHFSQARKVYHEEIPIDFRSTRGIVYNLLCYLRFAAIVRHIRINTSVYGYRFSFFREVLIGFLIFPFRLAGNLMRKMR